MGVRGGIGVKFRDYKKLYKELEKDLKNPSWKTLTWKQTKRNMQRRNKA